MTGQSNAASTTGNPPKAGTCPRCGGQLYAGLTHGCTTGVRPAAWTFCDLEDDELAYYTTPRASGSPTD